MNTDDIKNQTSTLSVRNLHGLNQTRQLHKAQADDPYTLFYYYPRLHNAEGWIIYKEVPTPNRG